MNFMKRNLIIAFIFYNTLLFAKASTPGFNVGISKTWTGGSIKYYECSGEIINASKLKLSHWQVEVPFDSKNNKFLGSWGCVAEIQDGKLVITGEVTNYIVKPLTNTTFGFIVSSEGSEFDFEKATLYIKEKAIPNHTKADGSKDSEDMNKDLPYENNRYFPETMDVEEEKAAASALHISEVKAIIIKELNEH